MTILRSAARYFSGRLGHDHAVVNALRPLYDRLLDWSSRKRGMIQELNGTERFRIGARNRVHFPEVYDPEVLGYLRTRVQPGSVSLNIGAHVGIYTLCLAEWSGPQGRVFAFEPNPATRAVLHEHVVLNAFSDRVEIVAKAVSGTPGEGTFFAEPLRGYSRLGARNPQVTGGRADAIVIPITTISEFCGSRGLSPDWITIDIEGYEIAALEGARRLIEGGCRPGIIVEMHPDLWPLLGVSRASVESVLRDLCMRPVAMTGQSDPLGEYGIVRLDDTR
jgi:FkbM family methyltransferase